jgi:hypothetical protein
MSVPFVFAPRMSRREQPIHQEDVPDDRDNDQQAHSDIRHGARE